MKFLLNLFVLIMAVNSCDSSKKVIEENRKEQMTISGSYNITEIEHGSYVSNKLIITFDNRTNKVSGFAGCNSFFGTYIVQKNNITFRNISMSKKFCKKEINDIENHFLKALNAINTFSIKGNVLSLLDNDTALLKGAKSVATIKGNIIKDNYKAVVIYESLSRGSFEYVSVSKSNISISTDKGLMVIDKYKVKEKDWAELERMIEETNMETFQKLKPPTDKRLFDGAAHATLSIIQGDVLLTTPTFDHGNPPEEIEMLVNKVLSIKENAIKQ